MLCFYPFNLANGRFVLEILDTGAFTMAVHLAVFDPDCGLWISCGVNRNIPAGGTQ